MRVTIQTAEHTHQRYETVGDWFNLSEDDLIIIISKLPDKRMELAVALHEFIEAALCNHRGIKEEDVTNFDIEFEKNRVFGNFDEPGDDPKAPYYEEHQFATKVERIFVTQLGLDWGEYEKAVNAL